MALTKGFVRTAGTDAIDARFFTAGLLQKNFDNTVRLGQLWGGQSAVSANSNMTVSVADGTYWVVSRGLTDGAVVMANVGVTTVTLATAPSANSRYDAIWVKHGDTEKGDADSNPVFGASTGVAAASPTVPAVPAGALQIATVLVPAGVSATNASGVVLTNTSKFTAVSGSPIRYRNYADLQADAANVVGGALAYVANQSMYVMRNGVWVRVDGDIVYKTRQNTSQTLASGSNESTLSTATTASNSTSDPSVFPLRNDGIIGPLPVAGYYEVVAQVRWSTNGSGSRYIEITKTDAAFSPAVEDFKPAMSNGGIRHNLVAFEYFDAGDYIKLKGWQDSGSALTYVMTMTARLSRPN